VETVESTYGSDKDGLVWGYRFAPGQAARPIDCEGAARLLSTSRDDGGGSFLWP
jgi:zinc transporter